MPTQLSSSTVTGRPKDVLTLTSVTRGLRSPVLVRVAWNEICVWASVVIWVAGVHA